ncbi:MAG: hypothetical protein ACI9X0_002819 [Kiritimatiellia bacterium]|jgi:hypothetical protein
MNREQLEHVIRAAAFGDVTGLSSLAPAGMLVILR